MSIGNSAYIQDLSDGLWGQYISGEASNLMRDSKWRGVEQLGLGLARSALQTYVNPLMTPKTYAPPAITKIQPSLKAPTVKNFGTDLTAKWQPQIDQNTLKLGLLESQSSNPMTKIQGQNRINSLMNEQQSRSDNMISETTQAKPLTGTQQAISGGAGALAGMGVGMGMNALGSKVFGDSQGGQFATQVLSQGASTVAGNVASTVAGNVASGANAGANIGSNLASFASNAGALTSLGAGIANVGLDVFDPVKKSKWESGVNVGLGLASLIPGVGPFAALGALAFNGIGHAFGQKTESFTANTDLLGQTNGSYGGSLNNIMTAQSLANTKHSLWDNSGRHKDDNKIFEAQRQHETLNRIIGYNNDRRDIAQSNSGILHTGREVELAGGPRLASVGKQGMVINKHTEIYLISPTDKFKEGGALSKEPTFIELTNPVEEFQQGGPINNPFDVYLQSLPKAQQDSTDFRVRDYWEFNGKPKNFEEAISKGMFIKQPDGWHANSVAENPTTGEIEFMKSSSHPNHHMEVDWYNSDDAAEFRGWYELQKTEPYWKYVKREKSQKFKEGGPMNVIPDGALHARKHNMGIEGVTSKGIPVVSEKEGGEIEQQAEIEKEEIIFRLEVTKKLEELAKDGSDDAAIEAGKLLVNEILYNTDDRTNNLL